MTGEEAISRLQALLQANEEAGHSDAAFLRALLPLARTGLLVERTLATSGFIVFDKPPSGQVYISVRGVSDRVSYNGLTLTAAVEAALKGQQ